MKIKEALTLFKNHQNSNLKQRTNQSYAFLLLRFEALFGDHLVESIGSEEIYQFLNALTEHSSKSTRRLGYAQIKAFYNLIIEDCCLNMKNPCSTPSLSKSFKMPKQRVRKILDKETVVPRTEIGFACRCAKGFLAKFKAYGFINLLKIPF